MFFIIINKRKDDATKWQRFYSNMISWLQLFWPVIVFAAVIMVGSFIGFRNITIIPRIIVTIMSGIIAGIAELIGLFILGAFISAKIEEEQEKYQKRIREETINGIMKDRNCSREEAEQELRRWEEEEYERQGRMIAEAIEQITEENYYFLGGGKN